MINILNTIPSQSNFAIGFLIAMLSVAVFTIFIFVLKSGIDSNTKIVMDISCVVIAISIFFCFLGIVTMFTKTETQYICTVKEDVFFTEFNSYFIIDKQEGLLYTVHIREADKK